MSGWVPLSHCTFRASFPFRAASVEVAHTATPWGIWSTFTTPGTFSAAFWSKKAAWPRKPGAGRSRRSACPCTSTSRPKMALPLTFSGMSTRGMGLPMYRNSALGSSAAGPSALQLGRLLAELSVGKALFALLHGSTFPSTARHSASGTFQVSAAALTQHGPAGGPGLAQRLVEAPHAAAAHGDLGISERALEAVRGLALFDPDLLPIGLQFIGHDHGLGRVHPLPHLGLPTVMVTWLSEVIWSQTLGLKARQVLLFRGIENAETRSR